MSFGSSHITAATGDVYIPELWSNEVIAAYMREVVMRGAVTQYSFNGKKGDTYHIPNFTRGSANAKAASTIVTFNTATHTKTDLSINKHYEYSYLIEDIVTVQAMNSLRQSYTTDAGYALAKQVDQDLHILTATLASGTNSAAALYEKGVLGSDGSTNFSGAANSNTGNGTALSDAGLRKMIQTLDDNDTPMSQRVLIIPPVEKNTLMGLSRFTEQAFVGDGAAIKNGQLGSVYGIPVLVSTNCPWVHVNSVTGTQSGTFSSTAPTGASYADAYGNTVDWNTSSPSDTKYRVGVLLHKNALALVEQMKVRSQTQYKQEYLADLFTADTIYGVGELRDADGLCYVCPA
jgi:N4-gp56 family major capsid protein